MKRILLIVVPLLLLLGGGGAAAYFLDLLPFGAEAAETEETADDEVAAFDPAEVRFVTLPNLIVNLSVTDSRRARFLKFVASLEVIGAEQAAIVEQLLPRVNDNVHIYLRAIHPDELSGPESIYRVKRDLLVRINEAVKPAEVRDVLIKEMLIQ